MRILVIGSGGREHAICWRLSKSPKAGRIFCAPGNPGTLECATNVGIGPMELEKLLAFAKREKVDLTVVGPEAPLCAGIADLFVEAGLAVVGPSAKAAQLEGSKIFAKQFMQRHNIPTASFRVFEDLRVAAAYIEGNPQALVVKADGLAAGKGVFVAKDPEDAKSSVEMLLSGSMGDAGRKVVVEERLVGEEVSVIAITDGERILPLASSQDHKAAFDGDAGPNTGGMGAYSPAPVFTPALEKRVMGEILEPTVQGMASEGMPYKGILYAGLMLVDGDPYVLEFNCRMGDPETQPLMHRFEDDLVEYLARAASGQLPTELPKWDSRASLCVVLASSGYPGSYEKGAVISGVGRANEMDDVVVFHAGTEIRERDLVTAGGRVLGVSALGDGVAEARARAYEAVHHISWEGMHFRTDIGNRALGRRPARC
ncbi:MAG: phosphoribosylamine--glycine ligase [Pseudomonadota bacterium]